MGGHGQTPAGKNKRRLAIVLALTTTYLVAEVVGGLLTNSLALLADAGHMLTDVAGLGLALLAIQFAERPATPERTYGYYRIEILAALSNAVILIGISRYILYEAYERFRNPPDVQSGAMLAVASVGLAVNIVGMYLLRSSIGREPEHEGGILRSALRHAYLDWRDGCSIGHANYWLVLRRSSHLRRHWTLHSPAHLDPAEGCSRRAA